MPDHQPTTVAEYLDNLPPDRRGVVERLRQFILEHLPAGYEEGINYGMISYDVPLSRYPHTYNKQPLSMVSITAQKRHYSLYLNCIYMDPEQYQRLVDAFRERRLKPDIGKSCVRFTKLESIPLDVIGEMIGAMDVDRFLNGYEEARAAHRDSCC